MLAGCAVAQAAPWVETGDLRARHHLEALSAMGCFEGLTLTWPMNWSAVAQGMKNTSDSCRASDHAAYLRARLDQVKSRTRTATVSVGGANQEPLFQHFAEQPRGEVDGRAAVEVTGRRFAARVEAQYIDNDRDDREARADGSYVAGRFGNWQLGVGAIDRWWGPGWQSSLAWSNNARPVTGLWIGRQTPYQPENPWFSWIGPWDFQVFGGQLEQDRAIPDAKLLGARLTLRPASFLQIGFTRLFQWGGEGRDQSLGSLGDAIIGKDNGQQDDGTGANDPSNQVAGFDFRASFPVFGVPSGFYGQAMGEDEAGVMPSKFSALFGLDALTGIGAGSQRFFIEASDTVAGRLFADARDGTAYEHFQYQSGFRYYGRNLATTYEGDARTLSLGIQQFFRGGVVLSATVTQANLNHDGGKRAVVAEDGAEILQAAEEQDVTIAELRLEHDFLGGRLTWALAGTDEAIDTFAGEQDRLTAMAMWQHTFDW
tara:strand:+ start:3183 stop:4637 length:1455 start_codon:yes stop_codon:yes gene_type:complete